MKIFHRDFTRADLDSVEEVTKKRSANYPGKWGCYCTHPHWHTRWTMTDPLDERRHDPEYGDAILIVKDGKTIFKTKGMDIAMAVKKAAAKKPAPKEVTKKVAKKVEKKATLRMKDDKKFAPREGTISYAVFKALHADPEITTEAMEKIAKKIKSDTAFSSTHAAYYRNKYNLYADDLAELFD